MDIQDAQREVRSVYIGGFWGQLVSSVIWLVSATLGTQQKISPEWAKERYPGVKPRVISDNGPQFIAKDFKEFIRLSGMTHVRTSPYYPQSNGKIERWHKSLKGECIRPGTPLSLEDALRLVEGYVEHYNNVRLNSAIGYITPKDMLAGRQREIHAERDRKLEVARKHRQVRRQQAA
jgi:putative transposase